MGWPMMPVPMNPILAMKKILFYQVWVLSPLYQTPTIQCGSGLAREGGLTFNIDVD
jgi:hypothetical protein